MSLNLLSLAQQALGSDFASQAGKFLGESPATTQSALTSLLPAVLGTVAQKGATPSGVSSLMALVDKTGLDSSSLGNIAGMFGSGSAAAPAAATGTGDLMGSLMRAGSGSLVPALFGDKAGGLISALSGASGMKTSSATSLVAMVVPMILMWLKKLFVERGSDPSAFASLLGSQGPNLASALDGRITSALGFGSPAAFLGGIGGAVSDAARRTGAAVGAGAAAVGTAGASAAAATSAGMPKWLPWIIGLLILGLLWWLFAPKTPAPTPAPTPPVASAPATPPPAAAPAPAVVTLPAKVYFETGSSTIGAEGTSTINAAAALAKKDNVKLSLTGYTDKSGDAAKNEELAKSRATAVRDALKAAGIAEGDIEMKPPLFVEVGGAITDAEARRVEISKQ